MGDDTGSEEDTDDDDTDDEDVDEEEDEEQDVHFDVFDNRVRMTIRFLVLLEERQERRAKDDPFEHLSWNVHERQLPRSTELRYQKIAALVKELTGTSFTVDQIYEWARMVRGVVKFPHCCHITLADCCLQLEESRRILQIPILKVPNQPPHIGSLVSPGWFVDPVLSMIQHSCEPNARPVVEHGKIMVLALKDIPVNGEVTFDYVLDNWLYDYSFRILALSGDWESPAVAPLAKRGSLESQRQSRKISDSY